MERMKIRQKEKANERSTRMENEEKKEEKKKRAERVYFRRARGLPRKNAF